MKSNGSSRVGGLRSSFTSPKWRDEDRKGVPNLKTDSWDLPIMLRYMCDVMVKIIDV